MTTEQLLLDRVLGRIQAEDHIAWAVARLSEGEDGPNLRILAGLNPRFDRDEVEPYFQKACGEFGIAYMLPDASPRTAATLVRDLYEDGVFSADEVVSRMAILYRGDYSDPVLRPWFDLEEDLSLQGSGYEGVYYPPETLEDLRKTVEREWRIFELATQLSDPPDISRWVRCQQCGAVGPPDYWRRSFLWRLRARLRGGNPDVRWAHCGTCGSPEVRGIGSDPAFREEWYRQAAG